MIVIDYKDQLNSFFEQCTGSDILIIPVFLDDFNHPANNGLSSLYIYIVNSQEDYCLMLDHYDKLFPELTLDLIRTYLNTFPNKIFCIFKKKLLYLVDDSKNLVDLEVQLYLNTTNQIKVLSLSDILKSHYERIFGRLNKYNYLVPIAKHIEYCQNIKNDLINYISEDNTISFKYYNNLVIPVLQKIESNGLYYDKELFKEFYPDKTNPLKYDNLYTEYNIFTSTGRPSNKFGGINFAALNKKTGLRKIFISRFKEEGKLLEFDFDAYHLQLIANEIDYKFPTDVNLHIYLGRQYFGKDDLTEEEYQQSKEISFRLLYGGIDKDFESIEFFRLVNIYIYRFWTELNNTGQFISPIFKRKLLKENIEEASKYTAWNYFIQLLETENSLVVIYQILQLLKNKKSKLILYTYDSFLFDVVNDEMSELKIELQNIFNKKGFHAKIKEGNNYDELKIV